MGARPAGLDSHTLIGSIIGVGVANQLMHGRDGTSGVDWSQATKIGYSLLLSPLVGFVAFAAAAAGAEGARQEPALYEAPKGNAPPPLWIRGLLILTCTGVSFSHGSNDGQKGMGLIMLILVGTVPTSYALNRTIRTNEIERLRSGLRARRAGLDWPRRPHGAAPRTMPRDGRRLAGTIISKPAVAPARDSADAIAAPSAQARLSRQRAGRRRQQRSQRHVPGSRRSELLEKDARRSSTPRKKTGAYDYRKELDNATKFIPTWVKVAVALALGLGTMVGWKRIVVTVGEKIGKTHLTYAQGVWAELVAAADDRRATLACR